MEMLQLYYCVLSRDTFQLGRITMTLTLEQPSLLLGRYRIPILAKREYSKKLAVCWSLEA
jgi:hypothetical protein